ncbi:MULTISPECIES: hypothetical protein [Bacillus]|uniref:hypothetical protein n=1 Tax=Bacillus TaxID=1386 RepID=UPI000CD4F6F8|nr:MULTISPECIES: hypothetical protein [Bacillus]KAF6538690.1 hypothetical protein G9F75_07240 [Bacillus sp. EKM208B]MDH3087150.1 hypothetical protein [Bacillus velezensis]MEE4533433.1 hypothetical protein [Bacillus velezensis]POI17235.1 hypothetical protein C2145_14375 [Bacillus velezensis]QHK03767.1 hypothetical protein C7M18_02664 [Bacillus velezensis]
MIKIKNPYSSKRLSYKDKFNKKFTDLLVPYIKKIRLEEDWSIKSKYIPRVLKNARKSIEGWDRNFWRNEKPNNIELDLLSLYVAEYIPTENLDNLNKGLKKLIKKFPSKHEYGQFERIDNFCSEVKQSIHSGRWSNFGFIDIGIEPSLSRFVDNIYVEASHVTSSSVILQFLIKPSDEFLNEYKSLVTKNIKGSSVFTPSLKKFFKFWGAKGLAESIIKNQMLEDLIIELKWITMNEISRYFDLYFTNNRIIPPSIEVYKLKQLSCEIKGEKKGLNNDFWRSVGMDNFYDVSKDGYLQLFSEETSPHFLDCSLKVTCNTEIQKQSMYHYNDFQIVYSLLEFTKRLLPILAIREYAFDVSKKVAIQQNKTFLSIKKENPNYNRLINVRHELERDLQILKRFKNEIGDNYFDNVKSTLKKTNEFEPSRPQYREKAVTDMIVDNTSYLVEKTFNHSQYFAKMIDEATKLLEIKTNNSLRAFTFFLTITTVIFSIIATAIAAASFYFQLSENAKDELQNLISNINSFFS